VLLTAHLLAPRLAKLCSFLFGCPMHTPDNTRCGIPNATLDGA